MWAVSLGRPPGSWRTRSWESLSQFIPRTCERLQRCRSVGSSSQQLAARSWARQDPGNRDKTCLTPVHTDQSAMGSKRTEDSADTSVSLDF